MAFETYNSGSGSDINYQNYSKSKVLNKEYTYGEIWGRLFKSSLSPIPNPLGKGDRIIIVDADAVVYRVSSACERRSVVATIKGVEIELPTKTKLKAHCERTGVDFDEVKFENKVYVEPIENCLNTLKRVVKNIYKDLDATKVVFFLGGSNNFRCDLPLPTEYKGNRKDMRRPEHLKACRDYLNKYYDTFFVTGVEADDVVQGVTSHIINNTLAWGCAYNLDKDMHISASKIRYYHPIKEDIVELGGGLGQLYLSKNSVKGDGLQWLCFQINQGDPSDGYSPKEFFKKRYGEKGYFKDFKECMSERELLEKWVEKWKELLPEVIEFEDYLGKNHSLDWLQLAELYFKAVYMRVSPEDDTTFESILMKYGAEYE